MEDVLSRRKKDISGILNGIDRTVWHPTFDKTITYRYTSQEIPLKWENKRELLSKFKFEMKEGVPLLGFISRLVESKGFELLKKALPELMKENLQLIILGTGEEEYHKFLTQAKKKYPNKLIVVLDFDEEMAHHIQAGCDIMLAPSKYEPCGLTHLYSLTYGTIPVARNTGGLADTITDHKKPKGNGFLFNKFDAGEFVKAINTAIGVYRKNRPKWNQMIRNGMSEDFSWKVSATKYMNMYKKLTSSK